MQVQVGRCVMAFNSKNLHYEKNEPAFLRKLRGEHGGDRQQFQAARPKRDRLTNDDDDAPAMVDEEGASVSKEDYEAMVNRKDADGKKQITDDGDAAAATDGEGQKDGQHLEQEARRETQMVADVGAAKKRKQAQVVGEDGESGNTIKDEKSKPVKKAKKKMKLSFDETQG